MEIITPDIERALQYVALLNEADLAPTPDDLDRFVTTKLPSGSTSSNVLGRQFRVTAFSELLKSTWEPGEPVAKYIIEMGWASQEASGGLRITAAGQALSQYSKQQDLSNEGVLKVFTSTPDQPLILSHLLAVMANRNSSTYIDPFLDLENVKMLIGSTPIRKVLTTRSNDTPAIQKLLKEVDGTHQVEIRLVKNRKQLHDRAILHEAGGVTIVGTSLNGVKGKYSVAVDLPASVVADFYAKMTLLWDQSTTLEPLG